jgi:hypothetical protein
MTLRRRNPTVDVTLAPVPLTTADKPVRNHFCIRLVRVVAKDRFAQSLAFPLSPTAGRLSDKAAANILT